MKIGALVRGLEHALDPRPRNLESNLGLIYVKQANSLRLVKALTQRYPIYHAVPSSEIGELVPASAGCQQLCSCMDTLWLH